jgi:putative acyl-CoA dehydrogenase
VASSVEDVATHEVTNQVPDLPAYDVVGTDAPLTEALARWAEPADLPGVHALGRLAGDPANRALGDAADAFPPRLRSHDPQGRRIDEVDYHPAYHQLMATAVSAGLTAEPWTRPLGSGAHLRRAAGFYAWSQVEAGHGCPISMTYAAAPALAHDGTLAGYWVPRLASREYDPSVAPVAAKRGAIAGMAMTEKQGGSDVRANTTRAVPVPGGPVVGETYRLTGHKWFCSAPMSDVFLMLAQAPAGLTCFVVPRMLDDGTRNGIAVMRLKDKLGNRANASSEIELDGIWGARLGPEGGGVRTIIDMVAATRLDCVLGSASSMRAGLVRAVHHARHRSAFGARLVDQPAMRNVLADLALESEAATLLAMRLAHGVDAGEGDLVRLAVALGKFWVCKRTAPILAEALECLGGGGLVEENGLARHYREAPVNSIWEGSGNVQALDVLRALARDPASADALRTELETARGADAVLDHHLDDTEALLHGIPKDPAEAQSGARRLVEDLAISLQASLVVRYSPASVAEAFLSSRVAGQWGRTVGTLSPHLHREMAATLDRVGS